MIYAIYKYGLRMEAIGFLDMYMFWHLQFSVSGFAIFGDSLYQTGTYQRAAGRSCLILLDRSMLIRRVSSKSVGL
jgi:hypothetical protein